MPRVYAIGDLHLSLSVPNKAMDVFGAHWKDHAARIKEAWQDTVSGEDLVLIPGDISWAMYLNDAIADLAFIGELKGTKLILRGNHDYWWQSVTKVRAALPEKMYALQNDVFRFGDLCICGTRGWTVPESAHFKESADRKLYERELIRLDLSLKALPKDVYTIGMLHFPPFSETGEKSGFSKRFSEAGVRDVVYGHLHGASCKYLFNGESDGVRYHAVPADYLNFIPKEIL
ncbi:MAG: metallophosphoesterase [Clostridia bacterium]|nr:metallophosphoesterase [Clostridia bacterium]